MNAKQRAIMSGLVFAAIIVFGLCAEGLADLILMQIMA